MITSHNTPFSPRKKGPGRRNWMTIKEVIAQLEKRPDWGRPGNRLARPAKAY